MNPVHALAPADLAEELESDLAAGLTEEEAARRLAATGPNELARKRRPAYGRVAGRQFTDPLVLLLAAAAAVSLVIGDHVESGAIAAIVLLNGLLGFVQEARAERAVLALGSSLATLARVVRDAREREIPVAEVVPGDLVVLREGDRIPADARLVEVEGLEADESALTGESVPVVKTVAPVDEGAAVADRSSMVFAGTGATRGRAVAVVTATGDRTEIGLIAHLTATARPPATPLQRRLTQLARWMVLLGGAVTVLLGGAMLARGASLHEAFLVGVAVAVATVPEGLAAIVTIALSLGAQAMAARGAIVRRLTAVETLGSATVIAADKTGTLTENRLRVVGLAPAPGETEHDVLCIAVLASTAELLDEEGGVRVLGDPIEGALLIAARERGLERGDVLGGLTPVYEIPFQPERRRMAVAYAESDALLLAVKGAPEVVLDASAGPAVTELAARARGWAEEGLRVLAVARRRLPAGAAIGEDVDCEVEPVGLVAMHDPLRKTAAGSLRAARAAGLEVRMLTGDHPATAAAIGRALELVPEEVHARVTPEDKLRIVEALQEDGHVVAVTGDGVNDAPALRRGDIGVAMGSSGTEAAREAADLVLTNDDFRTIVAAVEEGRRIAANVRKFVAFLLSANLGELVLFAVAILAGLGAPLTVVQVLLVNVVTDGLPALALARDPASPDAMRRGPTGARLLPKRLWAALAGIGTVVGACALTAYLVAGGGEEPRARTMAFVTVALAELALVFGCRSASEAAWRAPRNIALFAGVLASLAILIAAVYVPAAQDAAGTVALDPVDFGVVAALALVPLGAAEVAKAIARSRRSPR